MEDLRSLAGSFSVDFHGVLGVVSVPLIGALSGKAGQRGQLLSAADRLDVFVEYRSRSGRPGRLGGNKIRVLSRRGTVLLGQIRRELGIEGAVMARVASQRARSPEIVL